jgi:hypothetical protein
MGHIVKPHFFKKCSYGSGTTSWSSEFMVPETGCQKKAGYKFHLNDVPGFKFDHWYVTCYTFKAENGSLCKYCSLDRTCKFSNCSGAVNQWYDWKITEKTATSMKIQIEVGAVLSPLEISIEAGKVAGAQEFRRIGKAINRQVIINPNSTTSLVLKKLSPGSWYRVSTCAKLEIPDTISKMDNLRNFLETTRRCGLDKSIQLPKK